MVESIKMKKLFLTGAGGFVGQYVIDSLHKDFEIIGLVHPARDFEETLAKYIDGNILDTDLLDKVAREEKPDVILHLAARAATWATEPKEVFDVNFYGSLNLYQAVVKAQKEDSEYNPRIIYVSSAEVYGKTTNPSFISENDPFFPANLYAVSKVCSDRLSYQYSQTHKLQIVILRPFNHIGPGQQKGFFIPDMASQIAEAEKNPEKKELLVGNLESIRDIQDVRDVVEAYKAVIMAEKITPGEAYNISSGKGITMKDLLEKLLSNSTKKLEIKEDPEKNRPSDIPITVGDNTKFKSEFGWEPKHSIDEALKDTLDYWRKNL